MHSILKIAKQAIANGCINSTEIQQLQNLLKHSNSQEDVNALMELHQAVVTGHVKQTSDQRKAAMKKHNRGIVKMKLVCQTTFAAVIVGTIVFALPKSEQSTLDNSVRTMDIWQQ
jgi:rRNA pseudouridine-1189 N-methylase Emg1 (Nep1/Mra1 family)